MSDFQGWDIALLKTMGFPITKNNIAFVRAWHTAEGGTASYNPLNTTQPYQGATNYNSVGVKNFPNSQAGLQATMTTLRNGHYSAILEALKSGNPQWSQVLGQQLNTWGTGSSFMKGYRDTPTGGTSGMDQAAGAAQAAPGLDPLKTQLASMLINASQNGGQIDVGSLLGLAVARRQSAGGAGMGTAPAGPQQGAQSFSEGNPTALGQHIVQFAASQIGQPYKWGGESRKEGGFDCSGLVDYALRQAGINLPGRVTTQTALRLGQSVRGKALAPGDMIITEGGNHMVLYAGGGKVIAAPHTGTNVQYQPADYFIQHAVDIRRV